MFMFEWYNVVLLLNTIGFECCNSFADFQPVAQNIPERPNHYGQNPLRQFSTTTHLSDHPTSCWHSYSSNYSAANNTSRNCLDISSTIQHLPLYIPRTTSILEDKTQTNQVKSVSQLYQPIKIFPTNQLYQPIGFPPSNQLNQHIRISQGSSLSFPSSITSTKIRSPLLNNNTLAQFPSSEFTYNGISPSKCTIFASCTSKLFFTINNSNVGVNSGNNSLVYLVCSVPLAESPQKNYKIQIPSILIIKQFIIQTYIVWWR